MGILGRVFERTRGSLDSDAREPVVLGGRDTLEVVGESHYQEVLWRCVGGITEERVRHPIVAVLEPERHNRYDSNAIAVKIDWEVVGYLAREDAAAYRPGLQALESRYGNPIGLEGVIVGGGPRADGLGLLGVFLDHNPSDFGVTHHRFSHIGNLRTGLSEAIATDIEDDSYDLSWLNQLSDRSTPQDIETLRRLLANERDPIDRHYMLSELSKCLYKNRDALTGALDEFDTVCEQHHAEMHRIRPALVDKFGCAPVVDMYRQAAIRYQKVRNWQRMALWAERGLAYYGTDPARPEVVEDLRKRHVFAQSKLAGTPERLRSIRPSSESTTETLVCAKCGSSFERVRTRGRKPRWCPSCRTGNSS